MTMFVGPALDAEIAYRRERMHPRASLKGSQPSARLFGRGRFRIIRPGARIVGLRRIHRGV